MPQSGYDALAHEYYDPGHKTSRNFDVASAAALKELNVSLPRSGLLLEIGCGRGRSVEYFGVSPRRIVQLDASERMLSLEPRERCVLRVHAHACAIPLYSGQFAGVLGFLIDPFIGLAALAEAFRMLQPGGMILATNPTLEWGLPLRKQLNIDPASTRFIMLSTKSILKLPSTLFSRKQLEEMLKRVGFSDIAISSHCLPHHVQDISEDISKVARIEGKGVHKIPIINVIRATKRK